MMIASERSDKKAQAIIIAIMLLLGSVATANFIGNVAATPATTDESNGGSGGGGGESSSDSNEQEDQQQAVESQDDTPPAQTDEPLTPPTETPTEPEPEPAPPAEELPLCDGSAQDCVTQNGDVCLEGQGGHECECADDMSDCPNHPSLLSPLENTTTPPPTSFLSPEVPPVEEPTCPPGQFPVTPGDPSTCVDCEGPCPDENPVPPEEGPDGDCLFDPSLPKCASDNGQCPDGFFNNEDANCVPEHPEGCPNGYHGHEDDETGRCIPDSVPCEPGYVRDPDFPTCSKLDSVCEEHPTTDGCKPHNDKEEHKKTIIINKVINIVKDKDKRGHNNFPQIDIIGLSTKQNGDSMVCLINIDKEQVQCQDFNMPSDRVKGDFWRVIETNENKDYDNGNTGSDDIDGVIDDIKSQDFSELDDATNHDFGIDLAWIAINPEGDGVACLAEDSTGKGKSLCEPFKVNGEEIDGQITEGVSIENS